MFELRGGPAPSKYHVKTAEADRQHVRITMRSVSSRRLNAEIAIA